MLTIDETSIEKLIEMLDAQGGTDLAIRVAVMGGAGGGPGLGLIVDAAGESDVFLNKHPIPIIIDRSLIDYCRHITIEFVVGRSGLCGGGSGSGFIITPENPINF